jgi:hypothetical protein
MDIETAAKIFGPDRILIIGILQFLIKKNIIEHHNDMDDLEKMCRNTLTLLKSTKDPVALIQMEKTETELEIFFQSFKTKR